MTLEGEKSKTSSIMLTIPSPTRFKDIQESEPYQVDVMATLENMVEILQCTSARRAPLRPQNEGRVCLHGPKCSLFHVRPTGNKLNLLR